MPCYKLDIYVMRVEHHGIQLAISLFNLSYIINKKFQLFMKNCSNCHRNNEWMFR